MTPAERDLVDASCSRAAELWSLGQDYHAERWFNAALAILNEAGDFIDLGEADR